MKRKLGKNSLLLIVLPILFVTAYYFLGDNIFGQYIFSLIVLLSLNIILLLKNIKITNANFIFSGIYLIKYGILPMVYGFYITWAFKSNTLVYNWELLTKGNFGAILGLLGYFGGYWLSSHNHSAPCQVREILTAERCRFLFKVYLGLAFLGWYLIFLRAGSPLEVFSWIPVDRRAYTDQGWAFIYLLLTGAVFAQLCFMIARRNTSLWSLPNLSMMLVASFLLAIEGQRLTILTMIFGAVLLDHLVNPRKKRPHPSQKPFSLNNMATISLLGMMALGFSLWYGVYRQGNVISIADASIIYWRLASTFDTTISYFLAINFFPSRFSFWEGMSFAAPFLINIPTFIFKNKYDYIFNGAMFQGMVYGVDPFNPNNTVYGYDWLAELYVNFSWYGIPIVMLIFAFINNKMSLKAHQPYTTIMFKFIYIFYIFFFVIFGLKASLTTGLVLFINKIFFFFIIPVWLLAKYEDRMAGQRKPINFIKLKPSRVWSRL